MSQSDIDALIARMAAGGDAAPAEDDASSDAGEGAAAPEDG